MKKIGIAICSILFLSSCAEQKDSENIVFDPFENYPRIENQFFNLDTIKSKVITGKKGTKIYFDRNSFEVSESDKITLELKELYELNDLVSFNLRTVTNDNQLLESGGVLELEFKKNGEPIGLKDEAELKFTSPKSLRGIEKLYLLQTDSIGQTSWKEIDAKFSLMLFDEAYQIDLLFESTLDSLPYYKEKWRIQDSIAAAEAKIYEQIESEIRPILSINEIGWINIDWIIEPQESKELEFNNLTEVDGLIIYFFYDGRVSFINYYPERTDTFILQDVPILENTFAILVGNKEEKLFAEKIKISDNSKIETSLREVSSEELEQLILNK